MTCTDVQSRLSAFVDGDLDEVAAASVREHLLACEECSRVARELKLVADALAELPPEEPPPHLWRSIEARLDAADAARREQARGRGGWRGGARWRRLGVWALPASLGAAAAAAAMLVALRPQPAPAPGPAAPPAVVRGQVPESLVLVGSPAEELRLQDGERLPDHVLLADAQREFRAAEEHYLKATERLATLIARDRAARPFSPALAAAYERNLEVIDKAIARCRELAHGAPDDPWAQEVLYAAYQRKIRFLEEILRGHAGEAGAP